MKKSMSRLLALALAIILAASFVPSAFAAPIKPIDRDVQPALQDVYKDYFLLGNIYDNGDLNDTDRGNMYSYHYNVLTAQNYMKPEQLSSGNAGAAPNWTNLGRADRLMDEAFAKGIKVHGHVLVWHGQSPRWLNGGGGSGAGTYTRATAKANMELFIKTVLEHYDDPKWGDTLISWDVVNEAFLDGVTFPENPEPGEWRNHLRLGGQSGWYRAYGNEMAEGEHPSDFIYDAFVFSRKYSDTVLYYNDFNLFFDGKARAVAQMTNELNAQYAEEYPDDPRMLIEGIGLQSHNYIFETPAFASESKDSVEQGIKTLAATGAILSISELDLFCFYPWNGEPQGSNGTYIDLKNRTADQLVAQNGTDESKYFYRDMGVTTGAEVEVLQAKRYAEYFQVYKKYSDVIERVTFWGLLDNNSWRSRHNPLLWNSDSTTKEAFWAVADPDGYLGGIVASGLKLSTDKRFVVSGEYFNVTAGLDVDEASNAASITFTYDPEKFLFRNFEPAEGVSVFKTTAGEGKVTLTLGNLSGYSLSNLGVVLFSAIEDKEFENEDSTIDVNIDYVVQVDGVKSILSNSSSINVGTIIIKDYTLIDLSNVIDLFGTEADDELWSSAKFYDKNNNGIIDIEDIAYIASLIK